MARLHSKQHGKSGRKRAKSKEMPSWVNANPDDIKEIVRKLAKQGMKSSEIGIILRDQYALPSFKLLIGKTMVKFLKEENLYSKMPEDILQLIRKAVRLYSHLKVNKKDIKNKVKYDHIVAKINRLTKYYKRKDAIEKGWSYSPDTAALLVR
ncbi:MAG: 30S ribosomal protein S15 [Candidatus Micrarchaeota archaeon]|nr:30S ribosomal protein S15 [Candidatus Micrarchaeota archaeon]